MARIVGLCVVVVALLAAPAHATQFKKGSLIIPMDTTYQDLGMLQAFGLLNQLLTADVPVHWVIKAKKQIGDADFTVSAKDLQTGTAIASHGYRGGPFVIEDAQAAKATPVITAWQASHTTTVHVAEADFVGRTGRLLTAAPTIAVIGDGNEDIAFGYLNAAGIPDGQGNPWSKNSLDVLTIAEVAGPTTTAHNDGALFRASGQPAFCQIMTMHWGVKNVVEEVVAEYREFLSFPTHMMAECQAVNAVEYPFQPAPQPQPWPGLFLTTQGYVIDNNVQDAGPFEFLNSDTPFAQMDGTYELVGGSERAYTLAPGSQYHDQNIVMIKDASTTLGVRSIWMTGYIDGACTAGEDAIGTCTAGVGKVSYLGGHKYEVKVPISQNPDTQGTRLFLNSLFEASCTTSEGQGVLNLTKSGPSFTTTGTVTYTLSYSNTGQGPSLDVKLSDTLPTGATYVSSVPAGTVSGDTVSWDVGDLGSGAGGSVQLTVSFATYGIYTNAFDGSHKLGLNTKTTTSNSVTTSYQATAPDAGVIDSGGGPDIGVAIEGGTLDSGVANDGSSAQEMGLPPPDVGAPADAIDAAGSQDAAGAEDAAGLPDAGLGADSGSTGDVGGPGADGTPGNDAGTVGDGGDGGCDCAVSSAALPRAPLGLVLLVLCALMIMNVARRRF